MLVVTASPASATETSARESAIVPRGRTCSVQRPSRRQASRTHSEPSLTSTRRPATTATAGAATPVAPPPQIGSQTTWPWRVQRRTRSSIPFSTGPQPGKRVSCSLGSGLATSPSHGPAYLPFVNHSAGFQKEVTSRWPSCTVSPSGVG